MRLAWHPAAASHHKVMLLHLSDTSLDFSPQIPAIRGATEGWAVCWCPNNSTCGCQCIWQPGAHIVFQLLTHSAGCAGVKNLLEDEAIQVGGSNHSHATQDLYDNIAQGNYPEWTLYIQTMDPAQVSNGTFLHLSTLHALTHQSRARQGWCLSTC